MQLNTYTLPEISFVGGSTQVLRFYLKNQNGETFDGDGATSDFAICNYSNKIGLPLLSYTPSLLEDERGVKSILEVTIPQADTAKLSGKYIYQIIITDLRGESEIPNQGIMHIIRNIHQDYIPSNE